MLEDFVSRDEVPHAILFTGPSGCGKTTLARVMKEKLACSDIDFQELNAADFRGIDMVRDIRARVGLSPIGGPCRIWLIDECFPKGTLVSTPKGRTPIQNIAPGQEVYNLNGITQVDRVFRNIVSLSRIVKVVFDDGTSTVTTKQHLFLTTEGEWEEAQNLKGCCVFRNPGHIMNAGGSSNDHCDPSLRVLQKDVHPEERTESNLLFQKLHRTTAAEKSGQWTGGDEKLPGVQEGVSSPQILPKEVLLPVLSWEEQEQKTGVQTGGLYQEDRPPHFREEEGMEQDRGGKGLRRQNIGENEKRQPIFQEGGAKKDNGYEEEERHCQHLVREERGEWTTYRATEEIDFYAERSVYRVETRASYRHQSKASDMAVLLQSGHRTSEEEAGGGSGRRWTRDEKEFASRCQEDPLFGRTRVDRVEVYEPGCNDEAFLGAVSDQDRLQGFVIFYDLQIQGHPSYFANGCLVHNCHQITKDAQGAFLKLLEDTPRHVYFMLATTDPGKLLSTIKTRCTEVRVKTLSSKDLKGLIWSVTKKEDVGDMTDEVVDRIIEVADGSARKALVILESVLNLSSEDERLACILSNDAKRQAIDIARALFNPRAKWIDVALVLKGVTEDPETIRHLVLSYADKVLLGGGKLAPRAFMVIQAFRDNFYDGKKATLDAACYEVCGAK